MGASTATGSVTAPLSGVLADALPRYGAVLRALGLELAVIAGHVLLYPTGLRQEPLPLAPGSAASTAVEAAATVPFTARRPARRAAVPRAAADARPPVLLLHGFVDNRSIFLPLRRSLRRHGWQRVHAVNYSPLTPDIRQAAAVLGRQVESLCEQSGHARIDIVGHSLGGLIARYYVQRLGGDARVRTLVTLGTPHNGTRVAPFADTHPIVRQMRPGSELLAELAEPAPGCATRFIAFWSDLDRIMVPAETARLDHPDLTAGDVPVHAVGHLSLLFSRRIAAGVREALQHAEEAAGTADAA
ncbi:MULTISPECIES: lipase family alpha/beta hydrolase [Streptomycetaceae]|uniref:Lipase n=1 Tax=Streptantibioticus cattleyicolor (strain ATCC 35852 / DSM 46488 / JCM 4925 / NBRC 14057 / NRRL 8057) TaxID=1003195 RepID=F8JZG8_STREN|nr:MULTISPECIES: alpha/beta fold hydrolase [Streptomycetaceae]AEW96054.1 lipase [Streptantibioticus cattleyicolor NRRL 8057 = DSM 46488]MYS60584.1 alpha/beta fold hydrolase [Streptomyces sp. SID5468]CCB76388.1 putative secreted lipase [Streptantibioticus cattleyicolor NRRL 8057 = DSM 46488]